MTQSWSKICLLLIITGMSCGQASMRDYHAQGSTTPAISTPTAPKPSNIPGYQGENVPQAGYQSQDLGSRANQSVAHNEAATLLHDSLAKRPHYDIDAEHDPLITDAGAIVTHPEKHMNLTLKEAQEQPRKTIHTCTRGQDSVMRKCQWTLAPKKIGTRQECITKHVNILIQTIHKERVEFLRSADGSLAKRFRLDTTSAKVVDGFKSVFNGVDAESNTVLDIDRAKIIAVTFIKQHGQIPLHHEKNNAYAKENPFAPKYWQFLVTSTKDVPVYELQWQNDCGPLDALIDAGKCDYAHKRCVHGPATKVVDGQTFTAECWIEERLYQCQSPIKDTCQELLNKGCVQVSSKCTAKEDEDCIQWQQTFECYEGKQALAGATLSGEKPYCLDGDCTNQSWAPNQDMADSLSKLAIFKNMQKDMDPKNQTVFQGKELQCSRLTLSFKDCCVKKGWGMQVGLASCNANEKELAEQRQLNKCVMVGTYCAEKKLGVCLRKKTSYCCYASKMARLIHEQGRNQLGLNFGSPKNPQCQGLTLTQITKLDFSKIDFSELFQDLMANVKAPDACKISQGLQKSMQDKTKFTTTKDLTQGRSHGNF